MKGLYRDRSEAGRLLAARLAQYGNRPDVLVLALPRGGVPVGFEVARALHAPLDVFIVRKLGVPGHEELAMGAVATGGVRVINEQIVEQLGIPSDQIDEVAERELQELSRREHEVFDLILRGYTNQRIARSLFISVKTVETHRSHINRKLHVHSTGELIRLSALSGLLES